MMIIVRLVSGSIRLLIIDNRIPIIRYVTCIPSQGGFECAMTFMEESDNTDKSEPELQSGGGDDGYNQ